MRILFLAKEKNSSCDALEFLIKNNNNVIGVVIPKESEKLKKICIENNIKMFNEITIYKEIEKIEADLIVSFLFWKKIKKVLIEKFKGRCINFHPAPLPEYRGVGGYNFAILDDLKYWGVSVHYIDENIDTGKIIETVHFPIEKNISAIELENKSQKYLLELFKKIIINFQNGIITDGFEQSEGKYINKQELEDTKKIDINDKIENIDKKIRAFWFPPYTGAYIEIKGKKYTLLNEEMLKKIKELEVKNEQK